MTSFPCSFAHTTRGNLFHELGGRKCASFSCQGKKLSFCGVRNSSLDCFLPEHCNKANIFGNTPLILALQNNNLEVAALFASDQRFDLDVRDEDGTPAIVLLCDRVDLEEGRNTLQRFLARKCNVNAIRPSDGFTALHCAYLHQSQDCVSLLVAAGADESVTSVEGDTPKQVQPMKKEKVSLTSRFFGKKRDDSPTLLRRASTDQSEQPLSKSEDEVVQIKRPSSPADLKTVLKRIPENKVQRYTCFEG